MTSLSTEQDPMRAVLSEDEIMEAFQSAFPGHDLHQESIDFARAVERRVQQQFDAALAASAQPAPETAPDKDTAFALIFECEDDFYSALGDALTNNEGEQKGLLYYFSAYRALPAAPAQGEAA